MTERKNLRHCFRALEARVEALEQIVAASPARPATVAGRWDGHFQSFPATLRAADVSRLYGYTVRTVRNMAAARNPKIPTPSTSRPFGWNREDVRRHYLRRVT
jgi:hypothetical protein